MPERTTRMRLDELVEDFSLYPRAMVDSTHQSMMREAYRAGTVFEPIVADAKSKRIIDGFHRRRMKLAEHGQDCEDEVVLRSYRNEGEMFLDAMRRNANHGKNLSPFDRRRCVQMCRKYRLGVKAIASALGLREATVKAMGEGRIATAAPTEEATPGKQGDATRAPRCTPATKPREIVLKRTIEHMRGRQLTPRQEDANRRLSGMQQIFYVNQVLELVESGLLNTSDEHLMEAVEKLRTALEDLLVSS